MFETNARKSRLSFAVHESMTDKHEFDNKSYAYMKRKSFVIFSKIMISFNCLRPFRYRPIDTGTPTVLGMNKVCITQLVHRW